MTAVFGGAHYFSHKLHHGVQYFTNGGGGAVLETAPPAPGLFRFFSAVHHFLVLEVGYFGARLRAVNAQGEEFYSVTFDESVAKAPGLESPVETLTLGDGNTAPVNLTVFYDPAETPRDTLTAALRDAAKKADTPVLLTLRRMDAPDNRKLWSQSDPSGGPLPLVLLDDARLNGGVVPCRTADSAVAGPVAALRPPPCSLSVAPWSAWWFWRGLWSCWPSWYAARKRKPERSSRHRFA